MDAGVTMFYRSRFDTWRGFSRQFENWLRMTVLFGRTLDFPVIANQ